MSQLSQWQITLNGAFVQGAIQWQDEGVALGVPGEATTINLVGAGVTGAIVGNTLTITIPGGGGGGTVDSVVAGTGITVDNTDPANPIVNATGVVWESPKIITVGTDVSDFMTILDAMEAMANFSGNALLVSMTSDMTAASPLIASFPSFSFVEFAMGGFEIGANIASVTGGKDFCALSGNGTLNSAGVSIANLTNPIVGAAGTLTVTQNATFRNCIVNSLTLAVGGGNVFMDTYNSISTLNADMSINALSGMHHIGTLNANYAADPSSAVVAQGGSTIDVGTFNNAGVLVTTVYEVNHGTIFAGTITGLRTNDTNQLVNVGTSLGIIYG